MEMLGSSNKLMASKIEDQFKTKAPIEFINPFGKSALDHVDMRTGRPMFGDKGQLKFEAIIHFDSGASSGNHMVSGHTLQDLVDKVNAFIQGMP